MRGAPRRGEDATVDQGDHNVETIEHCKRYLEVLLKTLLRNQMTGKVRINT
jgi:hypothetical protein